MRHDRSCERLLLPSSHHPEKPVQCHANLLGHGPFGLDIVARDIAANPAVHGAYLPHDPDESGKCPTLLVGHFPLVAPRTDGCPAKVGRPRLGKASGLVERLQPDTGVPSSCRGLFVFRTVERPIGVKLVEKAGVVGLVAEGPGLSTGSRDQAHIRRAVPNAVKRRHFLAVPFGVLAGHAA